MDLGGYDFRSGLKTQSVQFLLSPSLLLRHRSFHYAYTTKESACCCTYQMIRSKTSIPFLCPFSWLLEDLGVELRLGRNRGDPKWRVPYRKARKFGKANNSQEPNRPNLEQSLGYCSPPKDGHFQGRRGCHRPKNDSGDLETTSKVPGYCRWIAA